MFKLILRTIFIVIVSFLLVGCDENRSQKREKISLLLDWLPNPNHVPLYAGKESEFFKKRGIDLEIIKLYDCSDTLALLNSGQADLAIYYMPATIQALSHGMSFKIAGTLIPESLDGFLVKKKANVTSFKDFENLTLGNFLTVLDRKLLSHLSKVNGIKFKSVKQIFFDPASALKSDIVSAVSGICWNIEQSQLEADGIETKCFRFKDFQIPEYHELVFLANPIFAEDNPDLIIRFREAINESLLFCQEHSDEAFNLYAKSLPDKNEKTLAWEEKAWRKTIPLLSKTVEPDPKVWKDFYHWMMQENIIKDGNEVDFSDLFL